MQTDPVSEMLCSVEYWMMDKVPAIPSVIHRHQNSLESTCKIIFVTINVSWFPSITVAIYILLFAHKDYEVEHLAKVLLQLNTTVPIG
jgi:hypothetical protein